MRIGAPPSRFRLVPTAVVVAAAIALSPLVALPAHAFEKGPEEGPELSLDRDQYLPPDAVLLEAEGFEPGAEVEITVSPGEPGTSIQVRTFDVEAEDDGGFEFAVTADPDGALGLHELDATARDEEGEAETAQTFYEVADHYDATIVTAAGVYLADQTVELTGSHFSPDTDVALKVVDPNAGFRTFSAGADEDGDFETSFDAGAGDLLGDYTVVADDGSGAVETRYAVVDQLGKVPVGFCGGDDWEPEIASDAYGHVYAAYTHFAGATGCPGGLGGSQREYLSVSNDAGATFGSPIQVFPPPINGLNYTNEADPVITVDEKGVVYYSTLAWGAQSGRTDVLVAKSTDFGQTWPLASIKKVNATAPGSPCLDCDHPWIAARGSNVYVEYTGTSGRHYLALSTDGGVGWSETVILTTAASSVPFAEGAVIDAAGNAWFAWGDCRNSTCATATSTDMRLAKTLAGTTTTTFTIPAPGGVPIVAPEGPACSPGCGFAFYGPQNDVAIDAVGNLYMIWQDGQVHTTAQSPPVIELASCPATSDCTVATNWVDKGRVDDKDASASPNDCKDASNNVVCRAVFPRIEGSATVPGRIAVQWIDDRNGSNPPSGFTKQSHTQGWNTYVRISNDGGTSWTGPGQQLSFFANDPNRVSSRTNGFGFPYGDYEGLTWICGTGLRTGSIWGEGVNYSGSATNHGNVITETTGTVPAAPASVSVSSTTATTVTIGWPASGAAGVTGYRIYRGSSLDMTLIGQVDAATQSFVDTPPAGTSFLYSVTTLTAAGEGCRSDRASVVKTTFAQTGIGTDTTATVATVGLTGLTAAQLPATRFLAIGTAWSFASTIASSTITGKHYDLTGAGSGVISAADAGATTTGAYTLVKATQTIDFPPITGTHGPGDPDFSPQPGATASSGLPVSYSASPSNVCTIVANKVHIVGFGDCAVTADQPGDAENYNAATPVTQHVNVTKSSQTITFGPITGSHAYGDANLTMGATASSGLTVTYTASPSGVCTIVSGKVHLAGGGLCTVTAHQAGNSSFYAAPDVSQQFTVQARATTTKLTVKPTKKIAPGGLATLTATVKAGGPKTTGLVVDFTADGTTVLGSAVVNAKGVAKLKIHVSLPSGTHQIRATTTATANFLSSASANVALKMK